MRCEWKEVAISDIGTVKGGATPLTKVKEYYGGDIPWITPKDLSGYSGKYIFKGERSLTKAGFDSTSVHLLPKGTVLFSSRAPIGYVAIAGTNLTTNQGFKSVIPNSEKILGDFLYYLLQFNKDKIENLGSGTTFKEVSGKVLEKFRIKIPSLNTQKRICNTLNFLDQKIELNNKINENLEQQAQAIFKSWFVDFEPFQDGKFVESELGMIPEGWKVVSISEIVEKTLTGDWGKDSPQGTYTKKVFCIRGADIPLLRVGDGSNMPNRYILEKNFDAKQLKADDIVIEMSGGSPTQSTGRAVRISEDVLKIHDNSLVCTNFCRAITVKKPYSAFLYRTLLYLYNTGLMFAYENGTTGIKNLDLRSLLSNVRIVLPPVSIAEDFVRLNQIFEKRIIQSSFESSALANLRDTLLPKLMSGEIEVPVE